MFYLPFLFYRCKFFSLTETPEDYTIIVDEDGFKGTFWSFLSVTDRTGSSHVLPHFDSVTMFDHTLLHQPL